MCPLPQIVDPDPDQPGFRRPLNHAVLERPPEKLRENRQHVKLSWQPLTEDPAALPATRPGSSSPPRRSPGKSTARTEPESRGRPAPPPSTAADRRTPLPPSRHQSAPAPLIHNVQPIRSACEYSPSSGARALGFRQPECRHRPTSASADRIDPGELEHRPPVVIPTPVRPRPPAAGRPVRASLPSTSPLARAASYKFRPAARRDFRAPEYSRSDQPTFT